MRSLAASIAAIKLGHPTRVAIDGVDGAGKTVLADELATPLRERGRYLIRATIDSFLRPRAERYRRGPDSPEGYYLDSHDLDAARNLLLLPLGPGGDRRYRTASFDEDLDRAVDAPVHDADRDAILLFDGIFAQRPELADCFDYRVFVAITWDEAERREAARAKRSGKSVEQTMTRYRARYQAGQRLYFAAVDPERHADAVVENTDPSAPVLRFRSGA